jgi:hypothetical protein
MKKFTNLLIVCSLALAGAVMAQTPAPEEQQSPGKKPDKKQPAVKEPAAPKTQAPTTKEAAPPRVPKPQEPAVANTPAAPKLEKKAPKSAPPASTETKASGDQPAVSATPASKKQQSSQSKKDMKKAPAADTAASPSASAAAAKTTPATAKTTPAASVAPKATAPPAAAASATPATAASASAAPAAAASATPAAAASASAAPSVAQTNPTTAPTVNPVAAAKKPDPAKVEQIRQQHQNFKALPRPDRVPAVTFSANFRLPGSDRWQGPQYEVYRSYHPERHDRGWYHSRYKRVELIGGGYYYFNNNYWYPAWGYSPTEEYYAYDAPVYAGKHAEPPDKVIADVQATLQEMGYYKGEVDGLLGPLTREALTGYQTDHGMTVTAVIDEPTLDSLGMG